MFTIVNVRTCIYVLTYMYMYIVPTGVLSDALQRSLSEYCSKGEDTESRDMEKLTLVSLCSRVMEVGNIHTITLVYGTMYICTENACRSRS